jgi:trehalose/maltose transport system substrate-binding protein
MPTSGWRCFSSSWRRARRTSTSFRSTWCGPASWRPTLVDLAPHLARGEIEEHFRVLADNNRVNGRLVALPWFADAGLLYYRRDLLDKHRTAVPKTWRDLTDTARRIMLAERAAGRSRMWGFVWQGRAYEGLTCNALEWVHSSGGGTFIDRSGKVTIDNAKRRADRRAGGLVGRLDLAARHPQLHRGRGARRVPGRRCGVHAQLALCAQAGRMARTARWPAALALRSLPHGPEGDSSATLGGSQLAVSRFSRAPDAAIDLVRSLTGAAEQRRRAREGGLNPTVERLYRRARAARRRAAAGRAA